MSGGLLVINKPQGISSFGVIREISKAMVYQLKKDTSPLLTKIKAEFSGKKIPIGHAGTLDPEAEGVLIVCIGEATKLVQYLMDGAKEYEALILLGAQTDTDDLSPEAQIIYTCQREKVLRLSDRFVQNGLEEFVGYVEQSPPAYSALKVGGKRMYELAKSYAQADQLDEINQLSEKKQRKIWIESISQVIWKPPYIKAKISCGKGAYIRAIARDLGRWLGVYGTLAYLERTKVGDFLLDESVSLEQIKAGAMPIIPMEKAIKSFYQVQITNEEGQKISQGVITSVLREKLAIHVPMDVGVVFLVFASGKISAVLRRNGLEFVMGRVFH